MLINSLVPSLVIVVLVLGQLLGLAWAIFEVKQEFFQRPGVHVSEVLQAKGYLAEEHHIISDDGYVLGMTRGWNPLVSRRRARKLNRQPMLFIHGTLTDGNSFVTNSFNVKRPSDWSHIDADKLTEDELVVKFANDPAAKTLPFFAMNFGHEVWFLHRRGGHMSQRRLNVENKSPTPMQKYLKSKEYTRLLLESKGQSLEEEEEQQQRRRRSPAEAGPSESSDEPQESEPPSVVAPMSGPRFFNPFELKSQRPDAHQSSTKLIEALASIPQSLFHGHLLKDIQVTFDRRLWNHSFDEQAAYDLPRAVDYVLRVSKFERTSIIGDSSGGALIMMSLILEQGLNDKLNKAIAWVPSFHIGHTKNNENFTIASPLFEFVGPYPLTFFSLPLQVFTELGCSLEIIQKTLCALSVDSSWGASQGKAPIRAEFGAGFHTPVSAHEYLQLIQMHTRHMTRMFDFNDKQKNLLAYGQEDTPPYDASLINFEHLSIYVATEDSLVTEKDVETAHKQLRVPHKIVTMRQKGANHGVVFFHEEVATMVIIPTYKDIISFGYKASKNVNKSKQEKRKQRHQDKGVHIMSQNNVEKFNET